MKERRTFVRIPRKGLVRFREMNLPKDLWQGDETIFKNISGGGLLFESPRALVPGTVLRLEIELRDWSRFLDSPEAANYNDQSLKLLAEVIRCTEVAPRAAYDIGVRFVSLDPRYQDAILQYLREAFKAP